MTISRIGLQARVNNLFGCSYCGLSKNLNLPQEVTQSPLLQLLVQLLLVFAWLLRTQCWGEVAQCSSSLKLKASKDGACLEVNPSMEMQKEEFVEEFQVTKGALHGRAF